MIKTRTIRRPDGKTEIMRVLSPDALDGWSREDPLAYEKSIVWTEDITSLEYVRVTTIHSARSRRGPLQAAGKVRVVGYAKLTSNAPRNPDGTTYSRRMFYVKSDEASSSSRPQDAVDPRSVLPGLPGSSVAVSS
jgi:hypothetical protein